MLKGEFKLRAGESINSKPKEWTDEKELRAVKRAHKALAELGVNNDFTAKHRNISANTPSNSQASMTDNIIDNRDRLISAVDILSIPETTGTQHAITAPIDYE